MTNLVIFGVTVTWLQLFGLIPDAMHICTYVAKHPQVCKPHKMTKQETNLWFARMRINQN